MRVGQNESEISCLALILAGGRSSRMGRDKALVSWQGIPLLQRVSRVAARCCEGVYILTPWPGRYRSVVGRGCTFLSESQPGGGPLVAFNDGLGQIPAADWVLLLACDLPQLQATILREWRDRLPQVSSTVLATVPRDLERWEPLCGFYRPAVRPQLECFLQQGGQSFQAWLASVAVEAISVSEGERTMLLNCNYPNDINPS